MERARLCIATCALLACSCLVLAQTNPDLVQSVTLLDAVRSALTLHTQVGIKRAQVQISEALNQQASAAFDDVFDAGLSHNRYYEPFTSAEAVLIAEQFTPLIPVPSGAYQDFSTLQVSDSRLLRDGISISPSYSQTHFVGNDSPSNFLGINTARVGVQITFPLLAGRGRLVTTAQERATGIEVNGTELDLRQTLSDLIAGASNNYWNVVAAQSSVIVARDSEKRGRTLVDDVQALIEGDQEPRSNLNNALANLEDRRATRILAEQHLIDARQSLALAMGLGVEQSPRYELDAQEDFPEIPPAGSVKDDAESIRHYIEVALSRRADYQASRKRVVESQVLRDAAKQNVLPRLDLTVQTGYSGISQGRQLAAYLESPGTNIQGADLMAGLNFRLPVGNRAAKAAFAQSQGQLRQAELTQAEIGRDIAIAVVHDLHSIQNALVRFERARAAIGYYRSGLQSEEDKLTLGIGSVVDILTVEDRLTTALQNVVQTQLDYFQSIVQFRYTTGTLIPLTGPEAVVDSATLTTFPSGISSEQPQ